MLAPFRPVPTIAYIKKFWKFYVFSTYPVKLGIFLQNEHLKIM